MAELRLAGHLADGQAVTRVTLRNAGLEAGILDFGARITAFRKADGPNLHVTGPLSELEGPLAYAGPIIGPVINRIGGAAPVIEGIKHRLDANEGTSCLHSGPTGSHLSVWNIAETGPGAVTFTCSLFHGEGGFPGNRLIVARYGLEDGGLSLTLTATTDAPTLMNPGSHAMWNLGPGTTLEIPAGQYLPTNAQKLPAGTAVDVQGTAFDYRSSKPPQPGLDHNFCFSAAFGLRARLTGPDQTLEIHSNGPGLQAYADPAQSVALEPQMWPDAPNHPAFPPILLRPGATFQQKTVFRIL